MEVLRRTLEFTQFAPVAPEKFRQCGDALSCILRIKPASRVQRLELRNILFTDLARTIRRPLHRSIVNQDNFSVL
jgi:hypothetical protein